MQGTLSSGPCCCHCISPSCPCPQLWSSWIFLFWFWGERNETVPVTLRETIKNLRGLNRKVSWVGSVGIEGRSDRSFKCSHNTGVPLSGTARRPALLPSPRPASAVSPAVLTGPAHSSPPALSPPPVVVDLGGTLWGSHCSVSSHAPDPCSMTSTVRQEMGQGEMSVRRKGDQANRKLYYMDLSFSCN